MNKYEIKGTHLVRLTKNGLEEVFETFEEKFKDYKEIYEEAYQSLLKDKKEVSVSDLMTGIDFAKNVKSNCIIGEDGYVSNVFVDGFMSNIRLCDFGLTSEKFGVNYEYWFDFCQIHDVVVDWCNK